MFKMASADWSIFLGVLVFIVALVFAIVYYFKFKKIYLILYIAAIATYIFSVFYTWDVFELNKNGVLLMLLASTVVMILLGWYFKKIDLVPAQAQARGKGRK